LLNPIMQGVVTLSGNSLEIIMQKVIKQSVVLPNIMNFGNFCELSLSIIEYLSITEKQKTFLLKSVKLTIKFHLIFIVFTLGRKSALWHK
jgi:hypothetical protein